MKVALLTDCYLPRLGGIEVQSHDLARQLVALGHEVEVFTATPGPKGERHGTVTIVDGIPVHRLAIRLPWELPVNPRAPRELRRRLVAGGFDVAHVQTGVVSPFAWDCTRTTVALGLPTAMTWHCMLGPVTPLFRALGFVRRWARAGVAMSAVSEAAAMALRRVVGPDDEATVVPNGIDVSAWHPHPIESTIPAVESTTSAIESAEPTGLSSGTGLSTVNHDERPRTDERPLRLVTAMRLAPRKRPVALVELVRRVTDRVGSDAVTLTILGEGPERRRVEALVRDHGLGWVRLPGRVPREELPERYGAADVYLSPAHLESFGIAALEARTAGLPVIGRSGSGISEFVTDGIGGRIVGGDTEMANVIAELVADRAQVERMRAWNLANPPSQDWPAVAARAVAEYERAIALQGARG